MRKLLSSIAFGAVAICMTSSAAMATSTCPTGQYSAYTGGGFSCATNNLTFSLFGFNPTASGGAAVPTAASVGVTPIDQLRNEGFTFNPGFNVSAGQSQDVALSFLVTAAPGTLIDDLSIGFNGSVTGNGTTVFSEKYCTGGFNTNCTIFTVSNPGSLDQHINITPTTQLWITKDFGATSNTGSASVSQVTNQYSNTSAVPEPASLSLMGLGLLGLGLIGRRRKA